MSALCPVELGAAADNVFALAYALLTIENADNSDASESEKATARDRLTYRLFLQSQELKNLVETGSIHGVEPVAAAHQGASA